MTKAMNFIDDNLFDEELMRGMLIFYSLLIGNCYF